MIFNATYEKKQQFERPCSRLNFESLYSSKGEGVNDHVTGIGQSVCVDLNSNKNVLLLMDKKRHTGYVSTSTPVLCATRFLVLTRVVGSGKA